MDDAVIGYNSFQILKDSCNLFSEIWILCPFYTIREKNILLILHIFIDMEKYSVIHPSSLLSPYVKNYWILEIDGLTHISERIIPTGYINLIFHKGNRMYSSSEKGLQPRSFVCGQSSGFTDLSTSDTLNMIVVVFQPHGTSAFFDIPLNEFYNQAISINDIEDKSLADLGNRIMDTADNQLCIDQIEQFLLKRLHSIKDYNYKRISAAIRSINTQHQIKIEDLAENVCLSYKQFSRIFAQHVGMGPKEFTRIVRFHRALYTLQRDVNINLTELTYKCGFYDQSHLIREFKNLSGYTPNEYLAVCNPYSDYFSER